ncbi:MAG: hypothetical protein RIR31_761 [Bacteroidota bacterium]
MLKRLENLGTALSRNESKMVVGGNQTVLMLDVPGAVYCALQGSPCGETGTCHSTIDECCCSMEVGNSECYIIF